MAEILDLTGKLTEGVLGIYYLSNGVILFSETVRSREGEGLYFDPQTTMVIGMQQHGNRVNMTATKLADQPFKPGATLVPESAIMMIVRTLDREFISKMRAGLSGIILPGMSPGGGMVN